MTNPADGRPDIRVLEERHMISVLFYIRDHEGCMKSEIYRDLSRTPRFPEKLNLLESNGLIEIGSIHGRFTSISLTDRGRKVVDLLMQMQAVMAGTDT